MKIVGQPLMLLAAALVASPVLAMFEKGSPVKQLTPSNFDRVLSMGFQPTFVAFYAPWCGHCKNLETKYEQAARRTAGIAQFYAVNCDEDSNRALCGRFNVQGFPTIKVFTEKRTKRGSRKSVDYQGERTARAMGRFARSVLPNLSKKLNSDGLEAFVTGTKTPKAVLLTEREKRSDLWKGISAQFANQVDFAHISRPGRALLERMGIVKLPAIVGYSKAEEPEHFEVYDEEIKHQPLAKFVKRISSGKTKTAGDTRKDVASAKVEVKEVVGQEDLERLCINEDNRSEIPVVCIFGVMALEPGFQESRDEHAQALEVLQSVASNQRMRSRYAERDPADDRSSTADKDEGGDEDEERRSKNALEPPFRVLWANALGEAGKQLCTILGLSDDLPAVVAVSPRKKAAAPYVGSFDSADVLEWAEACYRGHGMRRIASELRIGARPRAHDEL
ncbi:hypothetical protein H4217_006615 [Coemansia sp. RSA 1939]|nr:hypothetical protein H4217_006615 [Coemansia sp. RSA 1939]KAJ2608373.1 hypothetical protein EV177_005008 [Coemansia sp. RSA 1804]